MCFLAMLCVSEALSLPSRTTAGTKTIAYKLHSICVKIHLTCVRQQRQPFLDRLARGSSQSSLVDQGLRHIYADCHKNKNKNNIHIH